MNYQLNSRRRGGRRAVVLSGILIVLIAVWLWSGPPKFVSSTLMTIVSPVWHSGSFLYDATANATNFFKSKQRLIDERKELEEKVREMQLQLLDRNLLREENLELKELAGRVIDERVVLASILAKPNQSPYDTYILDVGEKQHVTVGNKIVVGDTVVIGEIVEVFGRMSKAVLYSTPGKITPVVIGTSGISVQVHGQGAGNFLAEVPRDVPVSVGDPIIAPGISQKLFGLVEDVSINPTDSFQVIRFQSPVNIFELDWVHVLVDESEAIIEEVTTEE